MAELQTMKSSDTEQMEMTFKKNDQYILYAESKMTTTHYFMKCSYILHIHFDFI